MSPTSQSADRSGLRSAAAPHVLREYALIADGERGAVVGPQGDMAWLCAPRWHSGSVFSTLIGGSGYYSVTPEGRFVWGGKYEDGSMIWRSRWITTPGIVECREALAFPGDEHRLVLLRQVSAVDCDAGVDVTLRPIADYDQTPMSDLSHHQGVWTARLGALWMRWTCGPGARRRTYAGVPELTLRLDLAQGDSRDLVLEISDEPLPDALPDPSSVWGGTAAAWQRAVPPLHDVLQPVDARRTYAVLRGLTSARGGMVAAATTSLPERAEAGRNYDYRYVWIRDQCYTGEAAAAAGVDDLLDDAVRFVAARLLEDGARLCPAYTVTGERIPDQRHLDLPGYPGGFDVIGNQVTHQFQLDAFGEALLLFAAAGRRDRLDSDSHQAMRMAAEAIGRRWREPDAGIWEIDNRAWTHSRLTAAAGLRAAAATESSSEWITLADRMTADTTEHALHADGYWQRAPDDPEVDAALLLAGLRGAIPVEDPRTEATLRVYLDRLTRDGYAYRFRHDERPLHDAEGSFLLCGYLTALSLHQHGDDLEARAWFERTSAACGPAQLFSEEYDVHQHQMRGNLPQAFVHALMLETAARLARD